jgi:hypothetical protein
MSSAGTNGTDLTTTLTTQGDIVYRDGSGLARLGAGTVGQVLQTGGAGANPSWGTVSSDYVKILTQTVSSPVAQVEFKDGVNGCVFDNTYRNYKVIFTEITGSSANHIRLRYMSGNTIRSSGYLTAGWRVYNDGSGNGSDAQVETTYHHLLNMNISTSLSTGSTNGEVTICNPSNASSRTQSFSHVSGQETASYMINQTAGAVYTTAEATTGLHFYVNGANITTGTFTLYGLKT